MQGVIKMGETKIAAIFLNLIGIPVSIVAFITNIDNVKSAVLFIVALIFFMFKIYFYVIWAKQKTRKNELELRRMEKDLNN